MRIPQSASGDAQGTAPAYTHTFNNIVVGFTTYSGSVRPCGVLVACLTWHGISLRELAFQCDGMSGLASPAPIFWGREVTSLPDKTAA